MVIARRFFGEESWLIVLALVVMLLLPPLITAFRAIANRHRLLIVSAFLLLPLFFDAVLKRILLAPLVDRWETTAAPVFGVPLFIVIVDVMVLTGFIFCRKHLFQKMWENKKLKLRIA
jgi:hypothetical protein